MEFFKYCPWDGYRFSENDQNCFICKRARHWVKNEQQDITKKKWEKILYLQQDFEDNYIDETFLSSVVSQDTSQGPDYKALINKSADLIFAINSVVTYLMVFYTLLQETVRVEFYLASFSLISLFGTVSYILLTEKMFKVHEILSSIKSIGIIIAILLLFSPVMLTVNQTYADNTIYGLTTFSILYHLLMRDYEYESNASPQTWKVNSATFASLTFSSLLASRLKRDIDVFVMLFSSFLFFIFAQFLKKSIKEFSLKIFKIIMISLTVLIGIALQYLSIALSLIYLLTIFFITFISPLQIIWLYQYKNKIQGPWDLPKVKQYD